MNKLLQLMGARNLTNAINSPAGGLPNSLPTGFMTKTRNYSGNIAQWKIYPSARRTARVNTWGAPSHHTGQQGFSTRSAIMLHALEDQTFGQDVFNQLTDLDGSLDELGESELIRQTAEFKRLLMNLRVHAIQSALALGKIYKTGTKILPSSSGATETIDLGVPATNLGTCNGIIGVKWDQTTGTPMTDIEELQSAQVKNGNPPLRHVLYGNGVAEALVNNPTIAKIIQGGSGGTAFLQGKVPDAFGMFWTPVGSMFHEAEDGTQTDMFSKLCVFTPDPNEGDWYELQQGSYVIPNGGAGIPSDAVEAIKLLKKVFGMFSFARTTQNPVAIQQFAGDTFLPVLKVPNAIWSATVLT